MSEDGQWQYQWVGFNFVFGPWYRLRALRKDGTSTDLTVGGRACEAVLQPDMDRSHWYWSVRFASYTPKLRKADAPPPKTKPKPALKELKFGGKVDTLDEARHLALARVIAGRPDVEGNQPVRAVEPAEPKQPKEVE